MQEVISILRSQNINIGGIITPEIRQKDGTRKGFKIISLKDNWEGILASIEIINQNAPRVGKYFVNLKDLEVASEKIQESIKNCDALIIDEIGKMELFSDKFKEVLNQALESDKPLIATVHLSIAQKFKEKGELIFLERENRDRIKERILTKLTM